MKRPKIDHQTALKYLAFAAGKYGFRLNGFCVLGIRGYYLDSKGRVGKNERGEYDDALVVISSKSISAWNANTDPSRYRPGIATLCPGVHKYRPGKHGISKPSGGHPAFRPATPDEGLPVTRDGQSGISRGIAINIHRGGESTTSSLGCQTIPPEQWAQFHAAVHVELKAHSLKTFDYVLIEETAFRAETV
jgi:lysozyme